MAGALRDLSIIKRVRGGFATSSSPVYLPTAPQIHRPGKSVPWRCPGWLCFFGFLLAPAQLAVAEQLGSSLIDQVILTYASAQQYESRVNYTLVQTQGRWRSTRSAQFYLALDRPTERLRLDCPGPVLDFLLVSDGSSLRIRSPKFPDRHVEAMVPMSLTYQSLREKTVITNLQPLDEPLWIDLVMLLSKDPLSTLADQLDAVVIVLGPDPDDPAQRPRLEIPTSMGTLTLSIDPVTKFIAAATHDIDTQWVGSGKSLRYEYEFETIHHNEPLEEELFDFSTANSRAAVSLDELFHIASSIPANPSSGHPLEGQVAPSVELKTLGGEDFKLSEVEAQVVILDFWATWCPPCIEGLRTLQDMLEWAEAEDQPVAVFAVNVGETADRIEPFWSNQALTMPVLMDQDSLVARDFGAEALPLKAIIANGKVYEIATGVSRKARSVRFDTLRKKIEKLLVAEWPS